MSWITWVMDEFSDGSDVTQYHFCLELHEAKILPSPRMKVCLSVGGF